MIDLGTPRRHFAGAERDSSLAQIPLNLHCERVHATENAPRDPFSVLERRHCLAEIVERGAIVTGKSNCVDRSHPERESMSFSKNALRHGNCFAQQRLSFFEAP